MTALHLDPRTRFLILQETRRRLREPPSVRRTGRAAVATGQGTCSLEPLGDGLRAQSSELLSAADKTPVGISCQSPDPAEGPALCRERDQARGCGGGRGQAGTGAVRPQSGTVGRNIFFPMLKGNIAAPNQKHGNSRLLIIKAAR